MTLLDYQRSFNGLVIGDGTAYNLMEETGLEGFTVRSGTRNLPRDDGAIPGLHLVETKTVILPIEVVGDPETDITPLVDDAHDAFAPRRTGELQYIFKNPGHPERFVWARPLRFERSRTVTGVLGLDQFQVALEVADPRIYSLELFSSQVPVFGSVGGGHDLPIVEMPVNMSAATQLLGIAENTGSRDAYPRIIVQYVSGTVSGILITNLTNGDTLDVNAAIATGQQLIIDMDAFIRATGDHVVSIGGSTRYGDWQVPRNPFRISPGSNTLKIEVDGGNGIVDTTVQWRNTN